MFSSFYVTFHKLKLFIFIVICVSGSALQHFFALIVLLVGSSAQWALDFTGPIFNVCVFWTVRFTALWGGFVFDCSLECRSHPVIAGFWSQRRVKISH